MTNLHSEKRSTNGTRALASFLAEDSNWIQILISISRHELNDFLFKIGGHVGYGVLPAFRRKGIAKSMLKRALPIAKSKGISSVLLTCDDDNWGSIKTIESCGGRLENKVEVEAGKPLKRRYWIEL